MRGPWKSPSLICNLDFHHEMSLNLHTWLLVNETVLSRLGANEDTVSQVESLLCARQSHRMKIFQVFHPKKEKKIPFFVSALTSCLSPTPTPSKVSWAPLAFVLCECVRVKSGKPALYCWTGEDTHTRWCSCSVSHHIFRDHCCRLSGVGGDKPAKQSQQKSKDSKTEEKKMEKVLDIDVTAGKE